MDLISTKYAKSYMHRDTVTHVLSSAKHSLLITVSGGEGTIKFWQMADGGLSMVKQFRNASGLKGVALSPCGSWLAALTGDAVVKFFAVPSCDMVAFKKIDHDVVQIAWGFRPAEQPKLLLLTVGALYQMDMESTPTRAKEIDEAVEFVAFHAETGRIFLFEPGFVVIDDQRVDCRDTFRVSQLTWSPDGSLFAVTSTQDRQIRIFRASNGRMLKQFDESAEFYKGAFGRGKFFPAVMQRKAASQEEFERRMLLEREVTAWNVLFVDDEFAMWTSPVGIKVVSLADNRLHAVIGGHELIRFGTLAFLPEAADERQSLELAASENPLSLAARKRRDVLCATAPRKNRFYCFTGAEPEGDRDAVNERPEEVKRVVQSQERRLVLQEQGTYEAVIRTNQGDIVCTLFHKDAPLACDNFVQLARKGYYDNCVFHRIIRAFMIQTGDPTGSGCGGESVWGSPFPDELSLKHAEPLMLSMANAGPNTNGSQFFITTVKCPWLDGKHSIFGKVTRGGDVVHRIEHCEVGKDDRPVCEPPPKILQIDIRAK